MDVVTAYMYVSLDSDIYMKVLDGILVSNMHANRNMYCVELVKSLYGLKQSGRMWYNRLKEFLLNRCYSNSDDCPCEFIRKSATGFFIISVYVNDLNIIGHTKDIDEAHNHLKMEFEMILKTREEGEEMLGQEYPYLSAIGVLMHLANNTRPNIAFVVNCLTRHRVAPTMRH
jgi:hypothetical protein